MGFYRGLNIVTDGLVFGYDADDRSTRFYPGEPTINLCKYTLDFSYNWNKVGTSITNNVSIAPDNTFTASMWICTNSTNHQLYQTHNNSGSPRVFSIYVKKTIYPACYLAGWNANYAVYFDLNNGVISKTFGNGVIGGIKYIDNGWFRIFIYMPSLINEVHVGFLDTIYTGLNSGPWGVFTVTGTSGYIWGPQIEAKQHPTPYIVNNTSGTAIRNNSQSLIDLKRTTTIDLSNVSFDSTAHPVFDGTNDYINTGYGANINMAINPISVCLIVKSNAPATNLVFLSSGQSRGNGDTNSRFYLSTYGGSWDFGIYTSSWGGIIETATTGYTHICCIFTGTYAKLYINGVYKSQKSYPSFTLNDNIFIGTHDYNYYWNGDVPIVKIYNKTLTEQEILQNYNAYKQRFNL